MCWWGHNLWDSLERHKVHGSLLGLFFTPSPAGSTHFADSLTKAMAERVRASLAAAVLALPTPLSIFTYEHFPDFFLALHVAAIYSLSLVLLSIFSSVGSTLFLGHFSSHLMTIFLISDPDSLHELVLQVSPLEAQGWNLLRGQGLMVLLPQEKRKPKELWYMTQTLKYELKA